MSLSHALPHELLIALANLFELLLAASEEAFVSLELWLAILFVQLLQWRALISLCWQPWRVLSCVKSDELLVALGELVWQARLQVGHRERRVLAEVPGVYLSAGLSLVK